MATAGPVHGHPDYYKAKQEESVAIDGITEKGKQMVKVFTDSAGRDITAIINKGWRVVQMSSCTGGYNHHTHIVTVLFEKE